MLRDTPLKVSRTSGAMEVTVRSIRKTALLFAAVLLAACNNGGLPENLATPVDKQEHFGILPEARTVHTAHYTIYSTAPDDQTESVSHAVEALYQSYFAHFGSNPRTRKFELVLYKDQAQFRVYNRSSPWAEAYYRKPRCYAYFAGGSNPYHWMIHEATHQLLRELSGYKPEKWINEGVASYFGASQVIGPTLRPGSIDSDAYPIWWLSSLDLSGDLERDIASGKIIPLRQLISDTGPDINQHVNLYYLHYWSLTHFLFHYRNGHYSESYKELIALGGSLDDFQRLIGPLDRVQQEWYRYLSQQAQAAEGDEAVRIAP